MKESFDILKVADSIGNKTAALMWEWLLDNVDPDTLFEVAKDFYALMSDKDSLTSRVLRSLLGVSDVSLVNLNTFLAVASGVRSSNG